MREQGPSPTPGDATSSTTGPPECVAHDEPRRHRFREYATDAARLTPDGWMLMGDLVTVDDEGYLTVVGRASDVIVRGGKNISAPAAEAEVAMPPAAARCAAIAAPDETFGERACFCRPVLFCSRECSVRACGAAHVAS